MNLRRYIDEKKITPPAFARQIRVSAQAMHRYLDGARIPRPEILARIAEVTDGRVQPNDFFSFAQSNSDVSPKAAA
jgi:hypothetical protein